MLIFHSLLFYFFFLSPYHHTTNISVFFFTVACRRIIGSAVIGFVQRQRLRHLWQILRATVDPQNSFAHAFGRTPLSLQHVQQVLHAVGESDRARAHPQRRETLHVPDLHEKVSGQKDKNGVERDKKVV